SGGRVGLVLPRRIDRSRWVDVLHEQGTDRYRDLALGRADHRESGRASGRPLCCALLVAGCGSPLEGVGIAPLLTPILLLSMAVIPSGARNPWRAGREAPRQGEQGFLAPLGMTKALNAETPDPPTHSAVFPGSAAGAVAAGPRDPTAH